MYQVKLIYCLDQKMIEENINQKIEYFSEYNLYFFINNSKEFSIVSNNMYHDFFNQIKDNVEIIEIYGIEKSLLSLESSLKNKAFLIKNKSFLIPNQKEDYHLLQEKITKLLENGYDISPSLINNLKKHKINLKFIETALKTNFKNYIWTNDLTQYAKNRSVLYHGSPFYVALNALRNGGFVGHTTFQRFFHLVDGHKKQSFDYDFVNHLGLCLTRDVEIMKKFGDVLFIFDRDKIKQRFKIWPRNWLGDEIQTKRKGNEREEFVVLDTFSKEDVFFAVSDLLKQDPIFKDIFQRSVTLDNLKELMINASSSDYLEEHEITKEVERELYLSIGRTIIESGEKGSKNLLTLDNLIGFAIKKNFHYYYGGDSRDIDALKKYNPTLLTEMKEKPIDDFVKELTEHPLFLGFLIE